VTARSASPRQSGHYSYAVYATREMAERFDARRFSGPIGTWLAETQEEVLHAFLGPVDGRAVLDVGTGTGRAALALARRGARVTGIDASEEMLAVALDRAQQGGARLLVVRGDAHHLSFPDRSFDAAVSLRVLMHTPDWRLCLGELCRVARERVVFDYPSLSSVAALQSVSRRLLSLAVRRIEAYRVLDAQAVAATLAASGFKVADLHKQFVLPIGLHRLIGSRRLSGVVEGVLARVGLLALLGSPVTVVAQRMKGQAPSPTGATGGGSWEREPAAPSL